MEKIKDYQMEKLDSFLVFQIFRRMTKTKSKIPTKLVAGGVLKE